MNGGSRTLCIAYWWLTEGYPTWSKKYDCTTNAIQGREEIDKARAFVADFWGNCAGGQVAGRSAGGHRVVASHWDQALDFDGCVWFIMFPCCAHADVSLEATSYRPLLRSIGYSCKC
jgi:hypothetical protein